MTIRELIKYQINSYDTHYYFNFMRNETKCHFFIGKNKVENLIRIYGLYNSGVFTSSNGMIFNRKKFLEDKLK